MFSDALQDSPYEEGEKKSQEAVGRVAIQGVGAQEAWTLLDAAGRPVRQGMGHQLDVTGLATGSYLFQASERPPVRLQVQALHRWGVPATTSPPNDGRCLLGCGCPSAQAGEFSDYVKAG